MKQTPEIKQKRTHLLDKFIHNERKAKLWAALSLLAFCATASTVLVVAYQIKGKGNVPVAEIIKDQPDSANIQTEIRPEVKTEPVTAIPDKKEMAKKEPQKEDPKVKKYIADLETRINDLEEELQKNKAQNESLMGQLVNLQKQLTDCRQVKPNTSNPPTPVSTTTVMIYIVNAASRIADTSVNNLIGVISRSGNSKNTVTVDSKVTQQGNKPCIIYYEDKFAGQANYIARILRMSTVFRPVLNLNVFHDVTTKGAANIVIWPGNFR